MTDSHREALADQKQKPNPWPQVCLQYSKTITVKEICQTGSGEWKKAGYVKFRESVEPGVRCVECATTSDEDVERA